MLNCTFGVSDKLVIQAKRIFFLLNLLNKLFLLSLEGIDEHNFFLKVENSFEIIIKKISYGVVKSGKRRDNIIAFMEEKFLKDMIISLGHLLHCFQLIMVIRDKRRHC